MKAISIRDAQGQLGQLVAEACQGEVIVLTDGDRQVTLDPRPLLNLEEDTPELEAELLKAAKGPFKPLTEVGLQEIADQVLREHRARQLE